MKVYLDTNTIIDFFINQAIAIKRNEIVRVPRKLQFFFESRNKVKFVISFFTEAEVARELVSGYGLNEDNFNVLWEKFLVDLNSDYIGEFTLDKELAIYPKKINMKLRTLVNFIHLFVAVKEDCYIVSGDNNLIEKVRDNKIYDKILNYIEFRRLLSPSL